MSAAAVCHEFRQNIVKNSSAKDNDYKPRVEPSVEGIAGNKEEDLPQKMGISRY
jgi:hypothetical protein